MREYKSKSASRTSHILLCTWHKLLDGHCADAEDPAQHEVHHERELPPEAVEDDEGQKVSAQLDAAADHKVEVPIAAQVGDGERDAVVRQGDRKPECRT